NVCSPDLIVPSTHGETAQPRHLAAQPASHNQPASLVALASVKLAQMPQTGSAPESAASAWVLPRQVTHRRWRSPFTRTCPQSGYCLDIFVLKVEESINTQAHYQQKTLLAS